MRDAAAFYNRDDAAEERPRFTVIPVLIVGTCLFFNFVLCFVNANVFPVSDKLIIVAEMIIAACCAAYGFHRINKMKLYWIAILVMQIVLLLTLSVANGELLMKPLRDIMIMPLFVVLGLSAYRVNFTPYLMFITAAVLFFAVLEAAFPNWFLNIFNFKSYFVAKGAMEDFDWLALNTFASGTRPDGRFLLDMPGVHRISSVFLEPVSLGYFAFIAGLLMVAMKAGMSKTAYAVGLIMCFLLIWLSDARMALGCSAIVLTMQGLFRRLDHRFTVLIFPMFLLVGFLIYAFNVFPTGGEGIGARVQSTMTLLSETTVEIFFGVSSFTHQTEDSGVGKLLSYQGFGGFALYWLAPIFFMKRVAPNIRVYLFGAVFFVSFGLLISSAIFTIKTAALLWFGYGYLIARDGYLEKIEQENG